MKIKAPFTKEQMQEIRSAQSVGAIPVCLNLAKSHHRESPWRRRGEYQVTSIGLICGECGHFRDELMLPLVQ